MKFPALFKKIQSPKLSQTQEETSVFDRYDGPDRWVAAASYIYFVSPAIILLRHDNSDFVIVHTKQALVILIIAILVAVFIPGLLWKIFFSLLVAAVDFYAAAQAWSGRHSEIPYLTDLSNSIDI